MAVHDVGTCVGLFGDDAVDLELALRKGVPLASLDRELCAAVAKAGGSLLLNPK